jgi:hypothetical protein
MSTSRYVVSANALTVKTIVDKLGLSIAFMTDKFHDDDLQYVGTATVSRTLGIRDRSSERIAAVRTLLGTEPGMSYEIHEGRIAEIRRAIEAGAVFDLAVTLESAISLVPVVS